jgi:putative membrane protein
MGFLSSAAIAIGAEHGRRGGLLIVILLAAIVGLLIWLVVRSRHSGGSGTKPAREILAERYARGEIDAEEYQQRREQLQ